MPAQIHYKNAHTGHYYDNQTRGKDVIDAFFRRFDHIFH